MIFKAAGVILLLLATYLAFQSFALVSLNAGARTLVYPLVVYPLVAIFLALLVRVLQAEKHHRDERANDRPQQSTAPHQSHLGSCVGLPKENSEPAPALHAREEAPWRGS